MEGAKPEELKETARKFVERSATLATDGFIVYDIQEEKGRTPEPRPFPFRKLDDPSHFAKVGTRERESGEGRRGRERERERGRTPAQLLVYYQFVVRWSDELSLIDPQGLKGFPVSVTQPLSP